MKTFYNKFMTLAICLVCLGVLSGTALAQNADIEAYQQSRNEYVFTLQISNRGELETLNRMASIAKVNGNEVSCFANQKEYDALKKAGYELNLIDNRPGRATFPMWDGDSDYNYDCYLSYEDYVWQMEDFARNHNNCSLVNLGATPGGHEIIGVRINHINEWRCPKVLLTGAIHGNEMLSTVAMTKLINTLLTDNSEEVQYLRENLDIFILPMLNPDGTYYVENKSVDGATRGNANGIDLNRNFPDNIAGPNPNGDRQVETQMLMDFFDEYQFTLAVNYHTGACVVNYPWDNTTSVNHADRNWWEYVSSQYVNTARATAEDLFGNNNTYMRSGGSVGDFPNGYVRGADWYVVYGGQQDYMNYYAACRSVTVEIFQDGEVENRVGQTYSPKASTSIANYVNANIPAALQLMKEATNGIQGRVYDSQHHPIEGATISINGHDMNGSPVMSHDKGVYFRPIKGGTYNVTYSAPGYDEQTVAVTVVDGQATTQNVFLELNHGSIEVDFSADANLIMPGGIVHFSNASAGAGELSYSWSFPGGTPSTWNGLYPDVVQYNNVGMYDVTLTVSNNYGYSETLTKQNYITVENSVRMCNGSSMIVDPINFYDSGGPNADYSNNESYVYTFYPFTTEHHNLVVTFSSFVTERNYDNLYVYEGASVQSPLYGTYHGSGNNGGNNAPTLITTNGPLTFKFVSDGGLYKEGWAATVACVMDPVYTVTATVEGNGTIALDNNQGFAGDVIHVTAEAAEGYQLTGLYYLNEAGARVDINLNTLSFVLPAHNVVVHAVFTELPDQITVNMCNGSITTGNALFYDHGGPNNDYYNLENYTYTFYPIAEGGFVKVEFLSCWLEPRYDKLSIYDGATTNNSSLIGTFTGRQADHSVFVSSTGPLTFKFTSDGSCRYPGWEALITNEVYTYYNIDIDDNINYGSVVADRDRALAGTLVTLTPSPADPEHIFFKSWNVTCGNQVVEVVDNQFVMPEGDVNVSATFAVGIYHQPYYQLVTNANEFVPGRYIIATGNNGNVTAMGEQGSSSTWYGGMTYQFYYFRNTAEATVVNNIMTSHEGACEFVMNGFSGQCNFLDEEFGGYLYCYKYKQGNSDTYALNTAVNPSTKQWEVIFYDEEGTVRIRNMKYARDMGLSDAGDQFKLYTVSYLKRLYLYRQVEGWWEEIAAKEVLDVAENAEVAANIYPNPTTGVVTLEAEGMQQLSVFNVMGQEVMNLNAEGNVKTLNLGGLEAGIYIIRICTDKGVAVKRVNLMH